MDDIGKLFKAVLAVILAIILIFSGLLIFGALLGVACIAWFVMWLKRKDIVTSSTQFEERVYGKDNDGTVIIEGEVEDVTIESQGANKKNTQ